MATNAKSAQFNMRMRPIQKSMIERAAQLRHKSVTEFILDAATEAAEDVLSNRRVFAADDAQLDEILEIMDQPVSENPELRRLLETPAPWER